MSNYARNRNAEIRRTVFTSLKGGASAQEAIEKAAGKVTADDVDFEMIESWEEGAGMAGDDDCLASCEMARAGNEAALQNLAELETTDRWRVAGLAVDEYYR